MSSCYCGASDCERCFPTPTQFYRVGFFHYCQPCWRLQPVELRQYGTEADEDETVTCHRCEVARDAIPTYWSETLQRRVTVPTD